MVFYPSGFPRQNAQHGAYSLAPQFGVDHADLVADLCPNGVERIVIPAQMKSAALEMLRIEHGIEEASLFPDVAGAAKYAGRAFPGNSTCSICGLGSA
jgi:hypothetical protein